MLYRNQVCQRQASMLASDSEAIRVVKICKLQALVLENLS